MKHAFVLGKHVIDRPQRKVQVGAVGYANPDIELPDLAVVVQDFANDFAVRDDHHGHVGVAELGAEQLDRLDAPFHANHGNVFPDPERLGEDNGQPGGEIAQHPLHREGDAGASHSAAGSTIVEKFK